MANERNRGQDGTLVTYAVNKNTLTYIVEVHPAEHLVALAEYAGQ